MSSREKEIFDTFYEDEEWLCYQKDTRSLLFKETKKWEWEEEIFEETGLETRLQGTTKAHVMVVNSLNI